MEKLLKLENVSYSYQDGKEKNKILEHVSYSFEKGKIYAVVGASGFRVIIVTVANSLGNIRVFELLPKLKTKKCGWCIA